MNEREKSFDELLNSLPPEALLAVSAILELVAAELVVAAEATVNAGVKAAELAKFKGRD